VSAIRWMCRKGQSSDPQAARYFPGGIHLIPNLIELVGPGDPLAGLSDEHVNKIKVHAWRGPDFVEDPDTSTAGSGWILAEDWWPYQRPTFVSPPFAGYISGHSTFSRAAAEVMTLLTGDEYFPGGMGEFHAPLNEFLVFEDGPSTDLTLQWATYRDASDQTSLSRIWGGIHPPIDDIPGRKIGQIIGPAAFALAERYFDGEVQPAPIASRARLYPNPVGINNALTIEVDQPGHEVTMKIFNVQGRLVKETRLPMGNNQRFVRTDLGGVPNGLYFVQLSSSGWEATKKLAIVR
jgi:hypothetical protein